MHPRKSEVSDATHVRMTQIVDLCIPNITCYIGCEDRSSRSRKIFKIGVFKNFAKFTGKQLCLNLFLIKLHILLEEISAQVFSCKICNIDKEHLVPRGTSVATPLKRRFPQRRKLPKLQLHENVPILSRCSLSFRLSLLSRLFLYY